MNGNVLPKRVRFFIADDIRADSPKPMIIGLLVDDVVGIEMSNGLPDPSKDAPIGLQSLAILVSLIGCSGTFEAETSLYQPDGTALFEHQKLEGGLKSTAVEGKGNINFIAKFVPFAISQFGKYMFQIKLDQEEYKYSFEIRRIEK